MTHPPSFKDSFDSLSVASLLHRDVKNGHQLKCARDIVVSIYKYTNCTVIVKRTGPVHFYTIGAADNMHRCVPLLCKCSIAIMTTGITLVMPYSKNPFAAALINSKLQLTMRMTRRMECSSMLSTPEAERAVRSS